MNNVTLGKWSLQNFKVHEDIEIDYTMNRLVTITGDNGSGKSTLVVDSICWALYGEDSKGKGGDKIVNKRIGKNTKVEGEWYVNDDHYVIKAYRKHKTHKNLRSIYKNGEDKTKANDALTIEYIEEIFMPKKIFKYCMMFSSFSTLKHSEQKDILDKILAIEQYDEYSKSITAGLDEVNDILRNEEKEVPVVEEIIKRNNDSIQKFSKDIELEKEKTNDLLKDLKEKILDLKQKVKNSEESVLSLNSIKESESTLIESVSLVENELKHMSDKRDSMINEEKLKIESELKTECMSIKEDITENNIKPLEEKRSLLISEINTIEKQKINEINDIKSRMITAREKYTKALEEEIFPITEKINKNNVTISQCNSELSSLNSNLNRLEESLQKLSTSVHSEEKKCSLCGQELRTSESVDNIRLEIQKLTKLISNDELTKRSNEKIVKDLREDIKRLDEKHIEVVEKFGVLKENLEKKMSNTLSSTESKFREELSQKSKEKSDIEEEIKTYTNKINEEVQNKKEEAIKKFSEKRENLRKKYLENSSNLTKEMEYKKGKLEDLRESIRQLESLKTEYESNRFMIESLKTQGIKCKENFENNRSQKDEYIKNLYSEIEECNEKLSIIKDNSKDKRKEVEILQFWKKGFSDTGIKAYIMDESIPLLNNKARELSDMCNCLKIKFDSQSQIQTGELRNKFCIGGLQTKNLSELEDFSAGEERMANIIIFLCLRNLLEHMQNIRFNVILLDEALDKLDPSNAAIVVQMIRQLTSDHCVVLITHTFREYIESDESIPL